MRTLRTVWYVPLFAASPHPRVKRSATATTTSRAEDLAWRSNSASVGSISYAFDDNGNTTSKTVNAQSTSYTYNYENWLTQITYPNQSTNTFSYDGGGIRFSKTDSAGTTKYVRDGDSLIAELDGTNAMVAAYTNGPNGLVSQRRNNATKFHHFDGLGSTRQLTDSTQTVTDTYSFDAYGNITGQTGNSTNPAKYVGSLGYYGDNDSGLMLLGHRYYDPTTGRFITLDPIKDGVNWYGYCGNNPVNATDPTGKSKVCDEVVGLLAALAGMCDVLAKAGMEALMGMGLASAGAVCLWTAAWMWVGDHIICPGTEWFMNWMGIYSCEGQQLPPTPSTPSGMCQQYCDVTGVGVPTCCATGGYYYTVDPSPDWGISGGTFWMNCCAAAGFGAEGTNLPPNTSPPSGGGVPSQWGIPS